MDIVSVDINLCKITLNSQGTRTGETWSPLLIHAILCWNKLLLLALPLIAFQLTWLLAATFTAVCVSHLGNGHSLTTFVHDLLISSNLASVVGIVGQKCWHPLLRNRSAFSNSNWCSVRQVQGMVKSLLGHLIFQDVLSCLCLYLSAWFLTAVSPLPFLDGAINGELHGVMSSAL